MQRTLGKKIIIISVIIQWIVWEIFDMLGGGSHIINTIKKNIGLKSMKIKVY